MNKKHRETKPNKQDFESIRSRMIKHNSQLRKEKQILLKEEQRNIENLDPKQVENIISSINLCYQNNDPQNAFLLLKHFSKSVEDGIEILYNRQLLQPMLNYMNSELNPSNIVPFIDCLSEVIDESFGSLSPILNSDLSNLLTKLFNFDDSLKISIINLLLKISTHGKESCKFLLQLNIIELYNFLTLSCMDNCKLLICKTIRNIFSSQPDGCDVVSRDLIKFTKQFLLNSNNECKIDIIWIFLYALEDNFINLNELLENQIITYFIQLLWNKIETINLPILKIFNFIYFESQTFKQLLLDNEILKCIQSLFPISNCDCWKESLFFLTNVAAGSRDETVALRNANLSPWIIYSLSNGTYRIQEESIYFFKNITKPESADQIEFWISREVVAQFCRLLRPGNTDMNCIILDTLICSLSFSPGVDELCGLFTDCNVIGAVEEANFHMTDVGYKLYRDLVSLLSGDESVEIVEDKNMLFDF